MAGISKEMLDEAEQIINNPQAQVATNAIDYDNGLADAPISVNPDLADYGFSRIEEGRHPLRILKATLLKQPGQSDKAAVKLQVFAGPEKGKIKDQQYDLGIGFQLAGFLSLAAACGLYDREKGAAYYNTMRDFEGREFWATVKHTKKLKPDTEDPTKMKEVIYANFVIDGYSSIDRFPVPEEDPFASPDGSRMPAATAPAAAPPAQSAPAQTASAAPPWGES